MESKNKVLIGVGWVLFLLGTIIGILFIAGLLWPSLESNFYFGYRGGADTKLRLYCPRFITPQDHASITAAIPNRVDKPINPRVEVNLTAPILQTLESQPTVNPGETLQLKWPVNADNLEFGHLIMIQVFQFSSYGTGTAMGQCGSLFLFIPVLTGTQLYTLVLIISLALIVVGIALWAIGKRNSTGLNRERFAGLVLLGLLVLVGIILGTLAQWVLGVFVFLITVVMLIVQVSTQLNPY